jgi:hypothetical protein
VKGFASLLVLTGLAQAASANGRAPVTNGVVFRPGDSETMYVRSTFGLLIGTTTSCTFRWVCEQNIGYGGTFDPRYAVAADGAIFATTFVGLRVSRDAACSFATVPELDAINIEALDIGPTGEIWAATTDSSQPNTVFRSTDNGATFQPRGTLSSSILWKSVAVAPSDPMRVYLSGYEVTAGAAVTHLYTSADAGETWTELAVTDLAPILVVAAIDPVDPSIVYLRSAATTASDHLYRTIDGGTAFTKVLDTGELIRDVVIDGAKVFVVTESGLVFRSDNAGVTFAHVTGAPTMGCLARRPDGTLVACATNWDPDFMAVGTSVDAIRWTTVFRFAELAGPVECPAGTAQRDVCEPLWPGLDSQFGPSCGGEPDGAPPIDQPGGCCDAGDPRGPLGLGLLTLATAVAVSRRARRR